MVKKNIFYLVFITALVMALAAVAIALVTGLVTVGGKFAVFVLAILSFFLFIASIGIYGDIEDDTDEDEDEDGSG